MIAPELFRSSICSISCERLLKSGHVYFDSTFNNILSIVSPGPNAKLKIRASSSDAESLLKISFNTNNTVGDDIFPKRFNTSNAACVCSRFNSNASSIAVRIFFRRDEWRNILHLFVYCDIFSRRYCVSEPIPFLIMSGTYEDNRISNPALPIFHAISFVPSGARSFVKCFEFQSRRRRWISLHKYRCCTIGKQCVGEKIIFRNCFLKMQPAKLHTHD